MIEPDVHLIRSEDVYEAMFQDSAVLIHVGSSRYFELNVTGRKIWELLADRTKPAAVLAALASGSAALDDHEQAHVMHYLETLVELNLVQIDTD